MRNFDLDLWLKDKSQKVVDEEGTPVEIFEHPQSDRLQSFLSKVL